MERLLRVAACVAVLALIVVFAPALRQAVPEELVPDPREWSRLVRELDDQARREREMDRAMQTLLRRLEMRGAICRELMGGRLTLHEAAGRLAELPPVPGKDGELARRMTPAANNERDRCRLALEWACDLLKDDPGWTEELRLRLEEELRSSPSSATRP